jgi:hypothetical protein
MRALRAGWGWLLLVLMLAPVLARAAADEAACLGCHPAAASAWKTSHHARAQQPATAENVLGNFGDVWFVQGSRRVRFFRQDGRFLIRTEGPDGQPADFPVRYTLGVYPLQQYLLPLPGGRLQAFDIAWDARPAAAGGQRWFPLEAHQDARPGDPLHWSGRALNANAMCATCHTTGFRAGYQPEADTYQSHWDQAGVGCLACHPDARGHGRGQGPAPRVASRLRFAFENGHPIARPQGDAATGRAASEACLGCHARRQALVEEGGSATGSGPGGAFLDHHMPALCHALGLWWVRQGRVADAAGLLARAARLAPAHLPYVQAGVLALLQSGQPEEAARLLALVEAGPLGGRPELRALAARVPGR